MSDAAAPSITAQAVERAVDPITGTHAVRVRFTIREAAGHESDWSIWVDDESDFAKAEDLARKELHRISSRIAESNDEPTEVAPPDENGAKPAERLRPLQRRPGGGWMGS